MERKQIRHRALRSCMSQKFSLELVHGLYFVFSRCWTNFRFATKGEYQTCRDFLRRERLHTLRSCEGCWDGLVLAPNATVALEIAAGSDSFVTGMVTFCFNESSEYWQFGDSELHIWLTCVQLSLIWELIALLIHRNTQNYSGGDSVVWVIKYESCWRLYS